VGNAALLPTIPGFNAKEKIIMSIIRDITIESNCEWTSLPLEHRDIRRTVNIIGSFIEMAYLVGLRERKVDTGKIQKIIIELREIMPKKVSGEPYLHENMIDVWRYNMAFDFDAFAKKDRREQCEIILDRLYHGMMAVCERLNFPKEPFIDAWHEVKRDNFIYRYTEGKPLARKRFNLEAQIVVIESPLTTPRTSIGAEVVSIDTRELVGQCTFFTGIRTANYKGRLKWIAPDKLLYIPKDKEIAPVEATLIKPDATS
jgi:hypothetical protein